MKLKRYRTYYNRYAHTSVVRYSVPPPNIRQPPPNMGHPPPNRVQPPGSMAQPPPNIGHFPPNMAQPPPNINRPSPNNLQLPPNMGEHSNPIQPSQLLNGMLLDEYIRFMNAHMDAFKKLVNN